MLRKAKQGERATLNFAADHDDEDDMGYILVPASNVDAKLEKFIQASDFIVGAIGKAPRTCYS